MYVYVRVPRGLIVHGRTGGINNNNNNNFVFNDVILLPQYLATSHFAT